MNNTERIAEIRELHEDWVRYEGAIHGGTGTGLTNTYSYADGHKEFGEWLIDGFGDFLMEYQRLTAELEQKTRELSRLAIESVEREKQLAELEAEVQYWADAEADGRLVVLAVKIGGSVWWNGELHSEPKELRITSASVSSNGVYEYGTWGGNFTPVYVNAGDFGKTVFLTRADAQAALSALGVSE